MRERECVCVREREIERESEREREIESNFQINDSVDALALGSVRVELVT